MSAQGGAWDDIDAALYVHPEYIDTVSQASLWMRRMVGRVSGTRSLVENAPQAPLDAAQAAVELARALPAARVMLERLELDGDVEEGGGLVTSMTYLLWADDEAGLDALGGQLERAIEAEWRTVTTVPSILPHAAVTAAVADAMHVSGRDFVAEPPPLPFATDFGAISRVVPSALIGVGRAGGWAFHTPLGERQFSSQDGLVVAMQMAEVLALSTLRLAAAR